MASGDLQGAFELLYPALSTIYINSPPRSRCLEYMFDAINEINSLDPSLIGPEKKSLIEVARIYLASEKHRRNARFLKEF
jgi:hypothetical protein